MRWGEVAGWRAEVAVKGVDGLKWMKECTAYRSGSFLAQK